MVEGEEEVELEEDEAEEVLAQREGRRRWAGRAGLKKLFRAEEGSWFPCEETDELTLRYRTISKRSHAHILYMVSRVPSVVFWTLGETTGIFQTGTQI